jgi:outer membrane protein W
MMILNLSSTSKVHYVKKILPVSALALALSPMTANADPTVGLGLNYTFGKNGTDVGVGVRVFSDDKKDNAALTLGLDYMFKSKGMRASVGAAYLKDNSYIEVNGGYNFNRKNFDMGIGGGYVETATESSPVGVSAISCPLCGLPLCGCGVK